MLETQPLYSCPTCQKQLDPNQGKNSKPFCSERCSLLAYFCQCVLTMGLPATKAAPQSDSPRAPLELIAGGGIGSRLGYLCVTRSESLGNPGVVCADSSVHCRSALFSSKQQAPSESASPRCEACGGGRHQSAGSVHCRTD